MLFVCSLQSVAQSPRESLQGFFVLPAVLGEQAGEELWGWVMLPMDLCAQRPEG